MFTEAALLPRKLLNEGNQIYLQLFRYYSMSVRTFVIVFCYGSGSSSVTGTGTGTVINYGSVSAKAKTCSGSATLILYTADTFRFSHRTLII
jgi:hypothetical protein